MKRRTWVFFWLFAAISMNCAHAQLLIRPFQVPGLDYQDYARQNKLKTVLRFGYLADQQDAKSLRQRTEYNEYGLPVNIYRFSAAGTIDRKEAYTYHPGSDQVAVAEIEQYKPDAELAYSLVYRFDQAGRMLEYQELDARGRMVRIGYTYDANGNILNEQRFEPDGFPGASEAYSYNAAGQMTESIHFGIGGNVLNSTRYTYGPHGKLVSDEHYLRGERLMFKSTYDYDQQGRPVRRSQATLSGEEIAWESWKYNAKGQLAEHAVLDPGDEHPMREVYEWDAIGRKTESKLYDNDGSIFQWYQYMYDSTGTGAGFRRLLPSGETDYLELAVYDEKGRVKQRKEVYPDGSYDLDIKIRYDESGLPVEEIHTNQGAEAAVFWFVIERY